MQSRLMFSLVKAIHCRPKTPDREPCGHVARLVPEPGGLGFSKRQRALSAARLVSCCFPRSSRSVWLSAIGYCLFVKRFSSLLVSGSVSDVAISNPTNGGNWTKRVGEPIHATCS